MKKRLLSAALALAMVLTLLPATMLTAFAADWTTQSGDNQPSTVSYTTAAGQTLYYYRENTGSTTANPSYTTVPVSLCTGTTSDGRVYGHWYWQANQGTDGNAPRYMEVKTGIITGTGASGQWYASVADYQRTAANGAKTINGPFTVLGTGATDLSAYSNSSLTINFANSTSSLTLPATLTRLDISAKYQDSNASGVFEQGAVGAINIDRSTFVQGGISSGLTVNANNIDITSIDLSGRANTLVLTDCKVGAINLDGETTTSATGTKAYNAQSVTANNCTLTGAITITNSDGGGVVLNNTLGGQAVNFTGNSSSGIRVTGYSNVGTITVKPRTNTGSYASVNITGGTVTGVTQNANGTTVDKAMQITVTGSTTNFGTINADVNGTVSITDADGTAVTVDKGTLTIGGSGVNISGDVTVANDAGTTLNITASKSTFGGVKTTNGTALTIGNWNGARQRDGGNNYGTLDLDTYDGRKVTGGTFAKATGTDLGGANAAKWLDMDNLLFYVDNGTAYDLYKKPELARAISDISTANASKTGKITVLGQADSKVDLTLMNGANPLAKIGYNATTPLILPTQINGMTITKWYAPGNHNIEFDAGKEEGVPAIAGGLTLNSTGSVNTAVNKITKATTTASSGTTPVVNQNVTADLTGNNIHITGAVVPGAGGIATVKVDLETDVIDEAGKPMVVKGVIIDCYMQNGKVTKVQFNAIQPEDAKDVGVVVIKGELVLNGGTGAHYTVTANVSESASRLGIVDDTDVEDSIVVTFSGKLASLTTAQKDAYAKAIATGGQFTYGVNQAMQQAINAAQATITNNNSVQGWITNAQSTIWRSGFKSPDATNNTNFGYVADMAPNTGAFNNQTASGAAIGAAFDKAYIVPYLAINVSEYDPAGTLTATLTPSYRVDVSDDAGYDKDMAYTVQTGRALNLTGIMTNEPVVVKLGTDLATNFGTKFMHQDGKYVYTGAATTWNITHLGANGTLGTVVINGSDGLIEINDTAADRITGRVPTLAALGCKYDDLQAAVDDTVRGSTVQTTGDTFTPAAETLDTITIDGQYTKSAAVTMTGSARKIKVVANGQQTVTASGANVELNKISTQSTGGYVYTIELKQDTAVVGNVEISVTANTAGSTSLSASKGKAGDVITVTVQPNQGNTVTGVTAKTNSGANVTVTASTTNANQYTFTVPAGATSVVVTPSFKVGNAQATVSVSTSNQGSVTTTAAATDNKVNTGSTVGVTTYPGVGYRTMGVNITTNGGATSASRVNDNYFTFTVPSNATAVTVTPVYDRDNGTKFTDVWSTEYYSKSVAWAVSKGITDGKSTYLFGSNDYCTRAQMVTFLWRAANKPSVVGIANPFVDVSPTLTPGDYYNAILWAVSEGITDGTDSTHFSPSKTVTRAEAVTFLWRYEKRPSAGTNSGFYDVPAGQWYARAVTWAAGKGITNGKTNTSFEPNTACRRCEIVTFLYRDKTGDIA